MWVNCISWHNLHIDAVYASGWGTTSFTFKTRHSISIALTFTVLVVFHATLRWSKCTRKVWVAGAAVWLTAAVVPSHELIDLNARRLQRRDGWWPWVWWLLRRCISSRRQWAVGRLRECGCFRCENQRRGGDTANMVVKSGLFVMVKGEGGRKIWISI